MPNQPWNDESLTGEYKKAKAAFAARAAKPPKAAPKTAKIATPMDTSLQGAKKLIDRNAKIARSVGGWSKTTK